MSGLGLARRHQSAEIGTTRGRAAKRDSRVPAFAQLPLAPGVELSLLRALNSAFLRLRPLVPRVPPKLISFPHLQRNLDLPDRLDFSAASRSVT